MPKLKRILKVNSSDINTESFRPMVKIGMMYEKIYMSLGFPIKVKSPESNIDFYWKAEFHSGETFSIYNWDSDKDLRNIESNLFWCIASNNPDIVKDVLNLFEGFTVVKIYDEKAYKKE